MLKTKISQLETYQLYLMIATLNLPSNFQSLLLFISKVTNFRKVLTNLKWQMLSLKIVFLVPI